MKATDFIRTQKHLNYFNNVRKMDECFGIDHLSKFFEPFDLAQGREAYLERVARIQLREEEAHAIRLKLNERMRVHHEFAQFEGFADFGYAMGGTVTAVCTVELHGRTFDVMTTLVDTRQVYFGRGAKHNSNINYGSINVSFKYANGRMTYVGTTKRIK